MKDVRSKRSHASCSEPDRSNLGGRRASYRKALRLAFLCGLLCAAVAIGGTGEAPQPQDPAQLETASATPDRPGTIDGSKNPELIPDEVAYGLFFLAVAEPENATDEQNARARAKITGAHLSEEDTLALLGTLAEFQKQINVLDSRAAEVHDRALIPQPGSSEWQQLVELNNQRDQLVANTIAALQSRLTEDGMRRLYGYLQGAKRGMKIFP